MPRRKHARDLKIYLTGKAKFPVTIHGFEAYDIMTVGGVKRKIPVPNIPVTFHKAASENGMMVQWVSDTVHNKKICKELEEAGKIVCGFDVEEGKKPQQKPQQRTAEDPKPPMVASVVPLDRAAAEVGDESAEFTDEEQRAQAEATLAESRAYFESLDRPALVKLLRDQDIPFKGNGNKAYLVNVALGIAG